MFIGSLWRSGSTLLDLALGQIPGFVAVGELRMLWWHGCVQDHRCGCGVQFSACPFWRAVGSEAFGGWKRVDAYAMALLQRRIDRARAVPRSLARDVLGDPAGTATYFGALRRVIAAIRKVADAQVVVDSSKAPGHALLLRRLDDVDLRLVHLVRDPRGVVFSQLRSARGARDAEGRAQTPIIAWTARWLAYNMLVPRLFERDAPRASIRYEDLVAQPRETLSRLLAAVGLGVDGDVLSFVHNHHITLSPQHLVWGNRMRFASGDLELRLDEEWNTGMTRSDRRAVSLVASPLLRRYGYELRS